MNSGHLVLSVGLVIGLTLVTGCGGGSDEPASVRLNRTYEGRLSAGDEHLTSGEYRDRYTFEGREGDRVAIEMRSEDFDPYLILVPPRGEQLDNDDFVEGDSRARLELTLTESGTYTVYATSFANLETGSYVLEIADDSVPPPSAGPVAAAAAEPTLRIERGVLEEGDGTLNSGEYRDTYTFEGVAGETVVIDLRSTDFDPYLILRPPTGEQVDNDDFEDSQEHSRLEVTLEETGTYGVQVTSFDVGETGAYVLELPQATREAAPSGDVRAASGRLEAGDEQLSTGEYRDAYTFEGRAGDRVVIDLRSDEFDPYLILRPPTGESEFNDDHEGSQSWSQIATTLAESGTYRVEVTTYKPGETGSYAYTLTHRGAEDAAGSRQRTEAGRLSAGDMELSGGEFADKFVLNAVPGNRIVLDLTSSEFDTYLVLKGPGEESAENDDFEESRERSRIEHVAQAAGEYTVYVTSYESGESGSYQLTIGVDDAVASPSASPSRDLAPIALGDSRTGQLESTDLLLEGRGFSDVYAFEGVAGQNVAIDLRSSDFDTFLVLTMPDGRKIENDDFEDSLSRSRIEVPIREAGRYRIQVSSYDADVTGAYTLRLENASGASAPAAPSVPAASGAAQTFGIFVGISDYPGTANDLNFTDRDAVRVYDALVTGRGMPRENGVLLTNSDATRGAFEDALRRIAAQARPEDTVVIFYSGHGNRVPRAAGPDRSDPDGQDETLVLYDRELTDDDLDALLTPVRAGRILLVFDSCFSGGFAKDVISVPGRMGLFSSEEDVTSAVAAKFMAGGYLSVFFADSLVEPYADDDRNDGGLTALELSYYISERYREQVKGPGDPDYVSASNLRYQKLVVDRGSFSPYDVVFRRR